MNPIEPIVSTDWLQKHLDDPGVRILDIRGSVSTRPVGPGEEEAAYRGAFEEYKVNHVPGAYFIDWTHDIIDPNDPVPAQLAGPERFARAMVAVGVGNDTHVVAVDHMGGQFAMRLWWALRAYGHTKVSVLEGGWNRWVEEERPVSPVVPAVPPAEFTPRPQPGWRTTSDALLPLLKTPGLQLIDARDAAQYTGAKRRGPRGGRIPGAIHVPRELFFAEGGGFLPVEEVRNRLVERGVNPDAPTTAYCNGGVAATVVLFNMARLGNEAITIYDGSWNEWGPRTDLPLEVGEK